MKKYIILAAASLSASALMAQTVADAARYGSKDIVGTARYRSMAGAFGALGGDPSSMVDNPAGLAIYRGTSFISFTPHLGVTSTKSFGSESVKDRNSNVSLPNLSFVISMKNPGGDNLVNFNLGFSINRLAENYSTMDGVLNECRGSFGNFLCNQANEYLGGVLTPSQEFAPKDWYSSHAPFLSMIAYNAYAIDDDPQNKHAVIDPMGEYYPYQRMTVDESTRLDSYNICGAWNFNDQFYLGATIAITDFNSTIETVFDEDYSTTYDGAYIAYDNNLETKGTGVGINLGMLWAPLDFWRIGAAIHTPTWGTITEIYEATMQTDDDRLTNKYGEQEWVSFNDEWKYDFSTPWEYQLSTAFILGNRGLVSLEYDLRDFSSIRYSENASYELGGKTFFKAANKAASNYLTYQHTLKLGGELRLTKQTSLRAGYAHVTSPFTEEARLADIPDRNDLRKMYLDENAVKTNFQTWNNQNYITCGAGWRGSHWTFDLSYMYHRTKQHAAAYPNVYSTCALFGVNLNQHNWDLTCSYRF